MRNLLLLLVIMATLATLASADHKFNKKLLKYLFLNQFQQQHANKYIVVPFPVPFGFKGLLRKGHKLLDTALLLSKAAAPPKKAQLLIHTTTGLGSGLGSALGSSGLGSALGSSGLVSALGSSGLGSALGSSGGWGDNQAVFLR